MLGVRGAGAAADAAGGDIQKRLEEEVGLVWRLTAHVLACRRSSCRRLGSRCGC